MPGKIGNGKVCQGFCNVFSQIRRFFVGCVIETDIFLGKQEVEEEQDYESRNNQLPWREGIPTRIFQKELRDIQSEHNWAHIDAVSKKAVEAGFLQVFCALLRKGELFFEPIHHLFILQSSVV